MKLLSLVILTSVIASMIIAAQAEDPILPASAAWHAADEWPQWLGPNRDGNSLAQIHLATNWKDAPLRRVWGVSDIPSDLKGGNGSCAVSDGRVYIYSNWLFKEQVEAKTIAQGALYRLGWLDEKMPPVLSAEVETTRLSDERATLKPADVEKWIDDWIDTHLQDAVIRKQFENAARIRLAQGRDSLSPLQLDTLATIVGRLFPSHVELNVWLAQHGIDQLALKAIERVTTTLHDAADDVVVCLDAFTGEKRWEARFPGSYVQWECSSTPTVAGDRVYVLGSGHLYCLSVKDGHKIFSLDTTSKKGSSSPLVYDGKVYVNSGGLLCLDAKIGKLLWKQDEVEHSNGAPQLWRNNDKTYVVCSSGVNDVVCVNAENGAVQWETTPGGGHSTPVIVGDYLVVQSHPEPPAGVEWSYEHGSLACFKMFVDRAEKIWEIDHKERGANPLIYHGYVYTISGGHGAASEALKVKLDTGTVIYRKKTPFNVECATHIAVDGKILFYGQGLCMIDASANEFKILTAQDVWAERCTSPVLAYGNIYVRGYGGVACFALPLRDDKTAQGVQP